MPGEVFGSRNDDYQHTVDNAALQIRELFPPTADARNTQMANTQMANIQRIINQGVQGALSMDSNGETNTREILQAALGMGNIMAIQHLQQHLNRALTHFMESQYYRHMVEEIRTLATNIAETSGAVVANTRPRRGEEAHENESFFSTLTRILTNTNNAIDDFGYNYNAAPAIANHVMETTFNLIQITTTRLMEDIVRMLRNEGHTLTTRLSRHIYGIRAGLAGVSVSSLWFAMYVRDRMSVRLRRQRDGSVLEVVSRIRTHRDRDVRDGGQAVTPRIMNQPYNQDRDGGDGDGGPAVSPRNKRK